LSTDSQESYRVLYVEDAFDQALLVKAFFNALAGFSVVHVQDGDHAMEKVENERWDLLVTDLNLPGADGFTIIRRARGLYPTLPILVTTGYTQAHYEEQALRAGADQVMIKPLTQNDFVSRVWSMIEREDVFDIAESKVVLALEGRLGDAEMGCGGTMMRAMENDAKVVVVPIIRDPEEASAMELKAASIAANVLGVELRVDRTLFGDPEGQTDLVERTVNELKPATLYLPAPDDRDTSRREAFDIGRQGSVEVESVFGYETATTGLDFTPSHFVDVRAQMVLKMEALATYQSVGAARADLRPRMAQAYARYWGRFRDFTEVEAFEQVGDG